MSTSEDSTGGLPEVTAAHPDVGGPSAAIAAAIMTERLDGFLRAGTTRLVAESDVFTTQLGVAATKVAKARGGTAVDDCDVAEAARSLRWGALLDAWLVCVSVGVASIAAGLLLALAIAPDKPTGVAWYYAGGAIALLVATGISVYAFPYKRKSS